MLGLPAQEPEQAYADVWICPPEQSSWSDERTVPFGELDPRSASEILRDLESCL
jgi:hypothetical protein